MKKYLFLLFSVLYLSCSGSRISELYKTYSSDYYLYWSENRKLEWSDFQGKPVDTKKMASEIIVLNPWSAEKPNLFAPTETTVLSIMDKKHSWVNKELVNEIALLYNQVIFDIHELYTRKIRKEFAGTEVGLDNMNEKFHSISHKYYKALVEEIQDFQSESKIGEIKEVVIEWAEKVRIEIGKLDDYKLIHANE